jgi:P27 family predicted phage terminase small subunit
MAKGKIKTIDTHKLDGTFRDDRHGAVVNVENDLVDKPSSFLTKKEKTLWKKWHPVLSRNQRLKETDEVAFGLLCRITNRAFNLNAELKDEFIIEHISDVGAVVKKENPLYRVLDREENKLINLLGKFGMTPESSSKIKTDINEGKDPFAELLNG